MAIRDYRAYYPGLARLRREGNIRDVQLKPGVVAFLPKSGINVPLIYAVANVPKIKKTMSQSNASIGNKLAFGEKQGLDPVHTLLLGIHLLHVNGELRISPKSAYQRHRVLFYIANEHIPGGWEGAIKLYSKHFK
ncbi:MAG: hypothetical protein AABX01_04055 [Candidatus Micrarchaeota archaeon]